LDGNPSVKFVRSTREAFAIFEVFLFRYYFKSWIDFLEML